MPDNEDEQRTSEAATIESSESAGSAPTELPDLADAIRAAAAEKPAAAASNDDDQDDDDEDASDASEQSPDEGSKPDAAPAADAPRLTRAERRRQELEQVRAEAQQHKERADRYESEHLTRAAEVQRLLGSDQEYSQLVQKRLDPDQVLTYDEESRYSQLTNERKAASLYFQQAQQGLRLNNEAKVRDVAAKHGLDADEFSPLAADAGALLDKAISATEARVRAEMQDEITRLTADRDSARLKLGGKAQDPGMGGRSGNHRPDRVDFQTAEPADLFAAAARENGRRT